MNRISVIIPSKTMSNLVPCIQAVRDCEPDVSVIVIDDGIAGFNPRPDEFQGAIIPGEKPFSFPQACNIGIQATGSDDVVLLNDDAILRTARGFSLLQECADRHPEFGLISATTNVAGNPDQFQRDLGLRETQRGLAFVCVFIPRRTIDKIGLMDERFGGLTEDGRRKYGYCDQDFTRRVRMAGLKIAVHDGCFVDHESLQSSFRGNPHASGDVSVCREIYQAKWGDLS